MPKNSPPWTTLPLRLLPGEDLRRALETAVQAQGATAAFVLAGVGSLWPMQLRLAGAEQTTCVDEEMELLTLTGSIAAQGANLHMSVSAASGEVLAGHVAYGCTVRTTAEVLVALLPGWHFTRQADTTTGLESPADGQGPTKYACTSAL